MKIKWKQNWRVEIVAGNVFRVRPACSVTGPKLHFSIWEDSEKKLNHPLRQEDWLLARTLQRWLNKEEMPVNGFSKAIMEGTIEDDDLDVGNLIIAIPTEPRTMIALDDWPGRADDTKDVDVTCLSTLTKVLDALQSNNLELLLNKNE